VVKNGKPTHGGAIQSVVGGVVDMGVAQPVVSWQTISTKGRGSRWQTSVNNALLVILDRLHQTMTLSVLFAVPVNIRRPTEEPPIATKVVLLVRTKLQYNQFVPFAVLVNIRPPPEEQPIAIFAVPASTSVILPPQPITTN